MKDLRVAREVPIEPAEEERQELESPFPHLIRFLIRSDELLNSNVGRSAIGAERTTLLPSISTRIT